MDRTLPAVCFAVLCALASATPPSDLSLEAAQAALKAGDAERAATMFQALAQRSESVDAEVGLVKALLRTGEFRQAMSYANLTAGENPDRVDALVLPLYLE